MIKKTLLIALFLISCISLSYSLSDFTLRLGFPAGNFGVEYSSDRLWIQGYMGGFISGRIGISSLGVSGGYEWSLNDIWKLRPMLQFYALQHNPTYESSLPTTQYNSYNVGLGIELRLQILARWSVTLGLPLVGVHGDSFGLPLDMQHYYLDALVAQAILSVDFRI